MTLALLTGCSSSAIEVSPEVSVAEEEPTPEPTQSALPEPTQSAEPLECDADLQESISSVIDSQIVAFGAKDFELAYSFASPTFRASVSLEQFVQIINGSYGPLIGSSNLVFSDCYTDQNMKVGVINAKFIQANNEIYGLQYLMVKTELGWRVQGASNLSVVGEGA